MLLWLRRLHFWLDLKVTLPADFHSAHQKKKMQDDTILHMLILFSCETLHFPQSQGVMEINLWVSVSPGILDDKVKYWSCRSKAQLTCALELGQLQEL